MYNVNDTRTVGHLAKKATQSEMLHKTSVRQIKSIAAIAYLIYFVGFGRRDPIAIRLWAKN